MNWDYQSKLIKLTMHKFKSNTDSAFDRFIINAQIYQISYFLYLTAYSYYITIACLYFILFV